MAYGWSNVGFWCKRGCVNLLVVVRALVKADIKAAAIIVASKIAANVKQKMHNREHRQTLALVMGKPIDCLLKISKENILTLLFVFVFLSLNLQTAF